MQATVKRLFEPQRGCDAQVENHCSKGYELTDGVIGGCPSLSILEWFYLHTTVPKPSSQSQPG